MSAFCPIPLNAISDSRLSKTDLRVLAALHYKNGPKGCFPSRSTLAKITGLAPEKVSPSVTRLVTFGWIKKEGRAFILHLESNRSGNFSDDEKVTEVVTQSNQSSNFSEKPKVTEVVTSKVTESGTHSNRTGYIKSNRTGYTYKNNDKNIDKNNDKNKEKIALLIEYLNEKTNSKFRCTETNSKFIRGRLAEGMTVDDLKAVVDFKTEEWANDKKMSAYLRPETLFGTKAEGYLQAASRPHQSSLARSDAKILEAFSNG